MGGQGFDQPLQVVRIASVDDIQFLSEPCRAVYDRGKTTDEDEPDTLVRQNWNEPFEVGHRRTLTCRPAFLNSSTTRWREPLRSEFSPPAIA